MTGNPFPFHVGGTPSVREMESRMESGIYDDADHRSFWLVHPELGRIGFTRLEDISDPTPMLDLRLEERFRGRGLGAPCLGAVTRHVFEEIRADRFEGQTRHDNIAMRRTFEKCGWVKEAHYRQGWPVPGGEAADSVAYATLRRDWETGEMTPFQGVEIRR